MTTKYHYWKDMQPEGHGNSLLIKPFMPPEDTSFPHPNMAELEAWTEANGWEKNVMQCVILANADWQSQPSYYMTRQPDTDSGVVTVEVIANFIMSDMASIDRILPWWAAYLTHLTNLGYKFIVAGDWEMGFTTGWKYKNHTDEPEFTMKDVIAYMLADPVMAAKIPRIILADLEEANHYGVPKNMQAHHQWAGFINKMMYDKLTEVFVTLTTDHFAHYGVGPVTNYNCQDSYPNCALRSWPWGHSIGKPAMGQSGPMLYLSNDTEYQTNADAMAAFSSISDPTECTVWVGNPNRNTNGWKQSQEQFDELNAWLEAQGVPHIIIF